MTAIASKMPPPASEFLDDVLTGLAQLQKTLPCQWFYDERGSELFEQITELPEYYLTRTETDILTNAAQDIAQLMGPDAVLIEYGAGASTKTRLLLDAAHRLSHYVPIDVSEAFLMQTAARLQADYPMFHVKPIVADFMTAVTPPDARGRNVGFFPGSTIGNLSDADIHQFLTNVRRTIGSNGLFILGYDRVKPLPVLLAAYDDAAGVTAAFNKNLLHRINHEFGANINIDGFQHEARWNAGDSRVEMHLVSASEQSFQIQGQAFHFRVGETIHTENSRKFTVEQMAALCREAGFATDKTYSDADDLFSVSILKPTH